MLLADICGFGSLFTEISKELCELMKQNVNTIKQTRAVRAMSCRLQDAAQRGGFASTLVSTYFAPTRSFTLCNAGHPPPLLYRAADDQWTILKAKSESSSAGESSLGVVDANEYQEFDTKLEMGDMVLSYSNALTECRGSEGGTIGVSGMLKRVQQLSLGDPAGIGSGLIDRIRDENAENLHDGDATLLLCQSTQTPVAWQDSLLAPFRLLKAASDRTRIG